MPSDDDEGSVEGWGRLSSESDSELASGCWEKSEGMGFAAPLRMFTFNV